MGRVSDADFRSRVENRGNGDIARRNFQSPTYRDQLRRNSGCAANQASGSSVATAGGKQPDN